MRKVILSIAAVMVLLAVHSCTESRIGSSLTATRTEVVRDSSFKITGYTVENTALPARTLTQLLGVVHADNYGTLSADFVSKMMPAWPLDTVSIVSEDMIDSCAFVFRIPVGGYTGDSVVPMRTSVYRLTKPLPSSINSSFDPSGYYDSSAPLGSVSYTATAIFSDSLASALDNLQDTDPYREFSVKVDRSLAVDIYREFKRNPEIFRDPATFESYFPGIYVTTSFGSGRVVNIYDTEFETYYRYDYEDEDTAYTINSVHSFMASTEEVLSNNNLNLEVGEAVKSMVANGDAIIQTPSAYEVRLTLPVQEILDRFSDDTEAQTVFNSVSLEIPAEELVSDRGIAPPEYLLLIPTSKKDEFLSKTNVPDNETSFYAQYDGQKDCYTFSEMRDYFIRLFQEQDGVAKEEDCEFTLTPIDVLFDEDNSSTGSYNYTALMYYMYYGYYPGYNSSSSSSKPIEVKPAMERPSIVKLDLDNAILKLYYSRLFEE